MFWLSPNPPKRSRHVEEVQTYYRTIDELSSHGRFAEFEDLNAYLDFPREKVAVFRNNPYLSSGQVVVQILGVTEGKIIGAVGMFPFHIVADKERYEVCACPLTHVHPNYRRTMYGVELAQRTVDVSADKATLNYGLSEKSARLNRYLKAPLFPVRQFAYVKRSRLFFAQRLPKAIGWLLCPLMDVAFWIHRLLIGIVVGFRTFCWKIERVDVDDEDAVQQFCAMIAEDGHRFREDMDTKGVRWILTNDFFPSEMADKKLYRVKVKNRTIGYFMTRRSEHGARGRILEWQTAKGFESAIPWMLIRAAKLLIRNTDAVVVSVGEDENSVVKILKRFLIPFTTQYAVVGTRGDSPLRSHEGWNLAANWRIRPAMGDGCFY